MVDATTLKPDLVAGLTLAAYLLPAGIGDASLAGPAAAGRALRVPLLRTRLLAVLQLAADGHHRHVGAVAAGRRVGRPARRRRSGPARGARGVPGADGGGDRHRVRGWCGPGSAIGFFSETVLVGFKAGLAFYLASTQLPKLFGFSGSHGDFWERVGAFLRDTSARRTSDRAPDRARRRWRCSSPASSGCSNRPVAFFVVVGGIVAARLFDLQAHGVSLLGDVPQGLPMPRTPARRAAPTSTR